MVHRKIGWPYGKENHTTFLMLLFMQVTYFSLHASTHLKVFLHMKF